MQALPVFFFFRIPATYWNAVLRIEPLPIDCNRVFFIKVLLILCIGMVCATEVSMILKDSLPIFPVEPGIQSMTVGIVTQTGK